MSQEETRETRPFETEVKQLLHLMIHSLYSNKEIFLRELISNASDAADKLRFEAVSNESLQEGDNDLKIRVAFDKAARTVTVSDNGIGMNRDEVVQNIGTIARSGTQEFFGRLSGDQSKDAHLIGQFGVGFYSSFIVADRVTLTTRRAGLAANEAVRWESSGEGSYTLETVEKASRGTEVVLHLREGEDEFLDGWRLRGIIRKFSDHINFPVVMVKEAYGEEEQSKEPEEETVNKASALWSRDKGEISEEDYEAFYKHVAHDFEGPLARVHAHLEGKYEFDVLLFIPKRAPFDLWDRERKHGVKLYVRRVFINEGSEELMPRYLRFMRGVIDSSDLPLNVSREILQQSPAMTALKKGAVNKGLGVIEGLAKSEPEKFAEFWKTFGKVLKEGIVEDMANKERIARLLRFSSTHDDSREQKTALADYVSRMKEGQEKIFYVAAESFEAARNSPHLEIFRKKGVEVLLLHDRVDEWLASHLTEFDDKPLESVTTSDLDLGALEGEEEKKRIEESEESFKELTGRVKAALEDKVKEVRITHRLTESPCCLVDDAGEIGANMGRILKSLGQEVPASKRTLELNPTHPLVVRLNDEKDEGRFADWSHLLLEQSLLSEGGQLEDPASFVRRLNGMLLTLSGQTV